MEVSRLSLCGLRVMQGFASLGVERAREIDSNISRKYFQRPCTRQKLTLSLSLVSDLIHCTNEPNVSIPQLANLLIERSQNTNWTVVFKALITVHHMMCYGNEVITLFAFVSNRETPHCILLKWLFYLQRFTQYLASSNSTFQLSNFLDKSGVQGDHFTIVSARERGERALHFLGYRKMFRNWRHGKWWRVALFLPKFGANDIPFPHLFVSLKFNSRKNNYCMYNN